MKRTQKLMLALIPAIMAAAGASAQKISADKVPASVKTAFAKANPGVSKVKWEMEKGNYEANYTKDGHELSALLTPAGAITETEMEIRTSELPAAVLSYVKANRKGASIKEAARITKANGEVNYEAEVKGKDMVFDAKGNFLKEVED